jgi:hypothetical protein
MQRLVNIAHEVGQKLQGLKAIGRRFRTVRQHRLEPRNGSYDTAVILAIGVRVVALVIVRNVHEMPAARLGMRGPEVVGPTRDRSQRDRRMIEGRRFLS